VKKLEIQRFVSEENSKDLIVSIVYFPPGQRTQWHFHECDQVLYILDGKGIVANESGEYEVEKGMFVIIPAGEKHWHGAKRDSYLVHIAIMKQGCKSNMLGCP